MKRDKTANALRLIRDYCEKIIDAKSRLFPSRGDFDSEAVYRDASAFYIQQIGEFVNDLSDDFIDSHPEIPWHQIRGFRNIIAHAYESVDADVLWESIEGDIPRLLEFCEAHIERS